VESHPRRREAWRPLAVSAVGALILSATLFGARATVALPASAPQVPEGVGSGTLVLRLSDRGAGFSQPVLGLAPGDVAQRTVTLTAPGSLDGRALSLQVSGSGPLTSALTAALTACPLPWDAQGRCPGSVRELLPPTSLQQLASPVLLLGTGLRSGSALHLRARLALPLTADEASAGRATSLTWSFRLLQA